MLFMKGQKLSIQNSWDWNENGFQNLMFGRTIYDLLKNHNLFFENALH